MLISDIRRELIVIVRMKYVVKLTMDFQKMKMKKQENTENLLAIFPMPQLKNKWNCYLKPSMKRLI